MNLGTTVGRWESFAPQITPCKWLHPQKSGAGTHIYEILDRRHREAQIIFMQIFLGSLISESISFPLLLYIKSIGKIK